MKQKKFFILTFFAFILIFSSAAQAQKQKISQSEAKPQTPVIMLSDQTDSSQYILGAYLGQYLNANGISIVKPDLFIRGMNDVLTGRDLLVNADSIPVRMNEFLSRMVIERNRTLEKQLFDNVKGKPGVGTMPDGVCYVIEKAGMGARPLLTDSISIHVKGYLPDGQQFEDTYTRNQPYKTTPANLIAGMKEILQIMPVGSVWRIYIPSAQAYGEKGISGVIPPYSALVFDVELLNIIKK